MNAPNASRRTFMRQSAAIAALTAVPSMAGSAENLPAINPGFVAPQYYGDEEKNALVRVIDSGSPFRYYGPGDPTNVLRFEDNFAKTMGVPYALGVTSGTTALNSAVAGLGVGPGDEVIVPAYTWWSDYTCVVNAGALPVFADIDDSLCLDPADFERRITPRTKAVIAVHLLGGPCDLEPILQTAKKHGIAVIEDCAQCVGGKYQGKRLGSIGEVGIYSFQLHKMISSGEGGAVATSDPVIYERAARFHDMGVIREPFQTRLGKFSVGAFAGENYRMSELTGAVLVEQLPKLDGMISDLRRNANHVREGIADLPGIQLRKRPDPDGDNGYGVYIKMKTKAACGRCVEELQKRKIPASRITGSRLLPIEESVISKRTRHANWPSFTSPEGKAIQYGPETCKQTLEIYDRFVQVRIGPKYTESENERIIAAIREAYALAG